MTSHFQDDGHDVISCKKCCHLASAYAASARRICMRASVLVFFLSAAVNGFPCVGVMFQCSFSVCMKEKEDNRRAAEEYARTWRSRSRKDTFECFYNTADYEDVIAEKVYSQSDVIHAMLWPSVVIVVCCAVFLRIETRRRHLTFCGRRPPPHESSAADFSGAGVSATPETARNVRVVVVRSSSTAGRFPGPNDLLESRLVERSGADVKPWKSYSSLEQMLLAPSSRSFESREFDKSETKMPEAQQIGLVERRTDEELKVVRDDRKLSLTIPGEDHRTRVKFVPGSCEL